jgi:hypothetical protein
MKKLLLALAFALSANAAFAQTTTYGLFPETCINQSCTSAAGVATDPAAPFVVDYFYDSRTRYGNPLTYGISIDGVMFTGIGGDIAQAPDGRQVSLVTNWTTRRTCTRSGRGQHCTTFYLFADGSVTPYF